ncbi:MAG: hypothetical protein LBR82_09690 [Desulfovibrio sp.]|jgi:hypothetical protein|nr:hypothetical protein [Desulfovibrio sp.]
MTKQTNTPVVLADFESKAKEFISLTLSNIVAQRSALQFRARSERHFKVSGADGHAPGIEPVLENSGFCRFFNRLSRFGTVIQVETLRFAEEQVAAYMNGHVWKRLLK